jgi:hypothetical protein
MQTNLKELTDEIKIQCESHPNIKQVSICTYEDLLIKVSERKNEYFGIFIVYDLRQIQVGEWSQTFPFTIIIADKLKANQNNEIFIHSNTLSIGIDIVKILRNWCKENAYDGLNDVIADVWTEDESDSLLAGTKLEFTMNVDIGGYCDYPQ